MVEDYDGSGNQLDWKQSSTIRFPQQKEIFGPAPPYQGGSKNDLYIADSRQEDYTGSCNQIHHPTGVNIQIWFSSGNSLARMTGGPGGGGLTKAISAFSLLSGLMILCSGNQRM